MSSVMIKLKINMVITQDYVFTDTDILMYEIKTKDIYKDFSKDEEMFDFSKYSAESKYYDDSNKLVVDEMKMKQVMSLIKNLLD